MVTEQEYFDNQKEAVRDYLTKNTATASMIARDTGIPHKNICRYKEMLEREGVLRQVTKDKCKITNHKAWYLTCSEKGRS